MLRFVLKRCFLGLFLAFVVLTLIFLSLHMVPGDPAEIILTGEGGVPPARRLWRKSAQSSASTRASGPSTCSTSQAS